MIISLLTNNIQKNKKLKFTSFSVLAAMPNFSIKTLATYLYVILSYSHTISFTKALKVRNPLIVKTKLL